MKKINLLVCLSFVSPAFAVDQNLFTVTGSSSSLTITTVAAGHTYPQAGIKVNTTGYQLSGVGSECTMGPKEYCLFSVSDTAPKTISISGSGQTLSVTLCLNGNGPLSCQDYEVSTGSPGTRGGYFTNNGIPSVYFCTFDPSTSLINSCIDAGQSGTLGFQLQGVVVNNAQTMAYFTTQSDSIIQCVINPADNTFSSCTPTTITTPSGYLGQFGFLTLNSTNTLAFLVDSDNRVLSCPITAGVISGSCSDTGATSIDNCAAGIVVSQTDSLAYVANGFSDNTVVVCDVSGGAFSNCDPLDGGGAINFNSPMGLAYNPSQSILYVADTSNNSVYGCSTAISSKSTKNIGSFSNCFSAMPVGMFPFLWGIAVNSQGTMAYVSDNDGDVYQCTIIDGGAFGTCTNYQNGSFFDTVNGMALIN